MSKLGFIGVGIMGRPMAGHLMAAGHQMFLWGRNKLPQDLLDKDAVACASPKEVAQKSEIVFVMVLPIS